MTPIWILLVVAHAGGSAVSFQEFASKDACESAAKVVVDLYRRLPTVTGYDIRTACIPKG